ncbi:hypothetical protein EJ06DRAFT_498110 [Trichodelitschia bisporula]|uniref:Nucleoporin NUP188 n=1 Tax=Trichodelitschia bisporula TaxID=703511 RepID=A0A6G1HP62_9PEZI|nr:hypothetical protein EJ06DRAFT_498110 [Trichodelitschia bisporula]
MSAAMGDSTYFPALEPCLRCEVLLLSWKDAYASFQSSRADDANPTLQFFFADPTCESLLRRPFEPFSKPSPSTKSQFETLTAAINVTPTNCGPYDIAQIRSDALWLSAEAKIDEVSALRIVVLEWQKRPAAKLLGGLFPDGIAPGVEACSSLASSIFAPGSGGLRDPMDGTSDAFESEDTRQLRILRLFLSEKAHILRISELLVRIHGTTLAGDDAGQDSWPWAKEIGRGLFSSLCSNRNSNEFQLQATEGLQNRVTRLESGSSWFASQGGNTEAEATWTEAQIVELISILQYLFTVFDLESGMPSADVVTSLFNFMDRYEFFNQFFTPFPQLLGYVSTLQTVISVVTLTALAIENALSLLDSIQLGRSHTSDTAGYLGSTACINRVHECLVEMAEAGPTPATPALFAWSFLLTSLGEISAQSRRNSLDAEALNSPSEPSATSTGALQTQTAMYVEAYQLIERTTPGEDPATVLATYAVYKGRLFDIVSEVAGNLQTTFGDRLNSSFDIRARMRFLGLIRASMSVAKYSTETLGALLSTISSDRPYWEFVDRPTKDFDPVAEAFVKDGEAMASDFLGAAQRRFPFESTPYYRLMRTVIMNSRLNPETVSEALNYVQKTGCLTQRLPRAFKHYEEVVDQEFEDEEVILQQRLTRDLPLFVSRKSRRVAYPEATDDRGLVLADSRALGSHDNIPQGTIGVASDDTSKPPVMSWKYEFSPLHYLVNCLHTICPGNDEVEYASMSETPLEEASEAIGLLTTLLTALQKVQDSTEEKKDPDTPVHVLLESTFVNADSNKTLTDIVCEIFEAQLQRSPNQDGVEASMEVLVRCVQFLRVVAGSLPTRLWPLLARSRFLELGGNGGSLLSLISTVEIGAGKYDLLKSSLRLFEALVDAAIRPGSVPEESNRPLTLFGSQAVRREPVNVLPHRTATQVLSGFLRALVSIFSNSRSWRYASEKDRMDISSNLSRIFDKVLHYVYGFDDEPNLSKKELTSALAESAQFLSDILLSPSSANHISRPLLDMLAYGLTSNSGSPFVCQDQQVVEQTKSALALCTTALHIGTFFDKPTSILEQSLFQAASLLARLYVSDNTLKSPVANLFEALVRSAARSSAEPPSLLGHMGPEIAKSFLTVLTHLNQPSGDLKTEVDIWKMLSAVISTRQQWFAIYLLTGSTPRDRSKPQKEGAVKKANGNSLLKHALDQLSELSSLPPKRALVMLNFVAQCQNHWPWTVGELRRHAKFIDGITKYIRTLQLDRSLDASITCNEVQIAAGIAEILAMYLHSAHQIGDVAAAQQVQPNLQYYKKHGVAQPSYNLSKHAKLDDNTRGLKTDSIKHTLVFPTEFGSNYYYDVPFASKALDRCRSRKARALQGSERTLQGVNWNLSLVEAQITLSKQWTILAIELSRVVDQVTELAPLLIGTVKNCLVANRDSVLPEPIYDRLRYDRLHLALVLLQKLVAVEITQEEDQAELRAIFPLVWETVRGSQGIFETAFANNGSRYYRLLLQILFLSLQPLNQPILKSASEDPGRSGRPEPAPWASDLLEVLSDVVLIGFQSLASMLHQDANSCEPSDFVLLTAILQSILRIPGIELLHSRIALVFANNNASGYATSLFSWADQLLIDRDPIYGELSILFLLELSSVPAVAENMAVEGVLSQLSSANLMQFFARPNGMGPFDVPTRLHSIWTKGILPLCLNLLYAVGAPIASEVVSFLNNYPKQLRRLSTALTSRSGPIGTRPSDSHITLNMASETHSLALISLIVERYRASGAATGVLVHDITSLAWDRTGVKEDVEDWVQGRSSLLDRIVPANERDAELARLKPINKKGGVENRLEERILSGFQAALECLEGNGI